jgi:glycosyltransferase involved in cell wall biosynthesis
LKYFKDTGATVVIEALSYFPGVKNKSLLGKSTSFMIWVKKGQLRKVIDKFVTEGTVNYFYGIPTEKGRIGVDTEYLPKHVYLGNKDELNLISVATERPYHGYDRLLKSLKQYNETGGSRPITIHFVGTLLKTTLDCIENYGLRNQVKYYGRLSGDRLKDVYNSCNVGIGPLAQHRIGGKKDTGLKTKEYLGIGLPYFYAGVEEDLPAHYPYAFQVPSDESCIDFEKIWQFYTSYRDREEVASFMRQTAEELYSWDIIMKGALNF